MKSVLSILLILNSIFVFSQSVKFNKSYIPIGNDVSKIYNIIATDTNYLCYGISQYLYPQSLLAFNLNLLGNIQNAKIYGDTNIVNFWEDGESIIIILTEKILYFTDSIILIRYLQVLFILIL